MPREIDFRQKTRYCPQLDKYVAEVRYVSETVYQNYFDASVQAHAAVVFVAKTYTKVPKNGYSIVRTLKNVVINGHDCTTVYSTTVCDTGTDTLADLGTSLNGGP